jgi:hypothetical protein
MEYVIMFVLGLWFGYLVSKPNVVQLKSIKNKRTPKSHGDYEEVQAELRASDPGKANIR